MQSGRTVLPDRSADHTKSETESEIIKYENPACGR